MKYSLMLTTIREFEDLEPLFRVSSSDAEIIIIDPQYKEQTKQRLAELKHDYCKVTYAPKMEGDYTRDDYSVYKYKNDKMRCHNTGFVYCEGEWVFKLDDDTELCPDFFKILDETISFFSKQFGDTKFVVRPVKLEGWSGHQRWDYPLLKQLGIQDKDRYILLNRDGLGRGFFITLDQFIATRESIDEINGMDERYDIGHGSDDMDCFQRYHSLGYKIVIDRELKTYQKGHMRRIDHVPFAKLLFDMEYFEMINGRYYAYNPFKLKDIRPKMLEAKKQYEIRKTDSRSPSLVFSGLAILPKNLSDMPPLTEELIPHHEGNQIPIKYTKEGSPVVDSGYIHPAWIKAVQDGDIKMLRSIQSGDHIGEEILASEKPTVIHTGENPIVEVFHMQSGQPIDTVKWFPDVHKMDGEYYNKPNWFNGDYPFDKFFTKEELAKNFEKILALKDKHKGEDLLILGNSPDITKEFIDKIRGKTTFAANGFIVMKDRWNYEPTYMIVTNQGTFDNHLRNMTPEFKEYEDGSVSDLFWTAKTTEFIMSDLILKPVLLNLPHLRTQERIDFLKKHIHIRILNKSEFEPPFEISHEIPDPNDICFDLLGGTYLVGTVITDLMLPLAVWMGFKNIYLKGCSGGAGHFYDTSPRHFWDIDKQNHMYGDIYAIFKKLLNEHRINIYNLDRPTSYDIAAESESRLAYNPTKSDGHFWDGPIMHHVLGKAPYAIEYKPVEEIL